MECGNEIALTVMLRNAKKKCCQIWEEIKKCVPKVNQIWQSLKKVEMVC